MRLLLKCPTRSRPQRVIETLRKYISLANHPEQIGVAISCDENDSTMSRNLVQEEIRSILRPTAWHRMFFSPNTSKIEACNANMSQIEWEWDVVVLVSDDMVPQIKGYDDVIRSHMMAYFPKRDGILWFNDGHQGNNLNTLCIFGREFYNSQGYIYQPEYKSLFCDTELTDQCNRVLAKKCAYIPYCIIRHEHPGTGFTDRNDALYQHNQKFWDEDMNTYIRRKSYPFDWSVLIPTMPGRESGLQSLITSIREKVERLCPALRIEFCLSFDNRESSIGAKRQRLVEKASGKYLSFIDDDDSITDAYVEDVAELVKSGCHTMRLRGDMSGYTFIHSTAITLKDPMVTLSDPPIFQRPPNHLNPMMSDIAKLVPFQDAVRGEDIDWTVRLFKSGFLQTEYRSDESRTHYNYNLGTRTIQPNTIVIQRLISFEEMVKKLLIPANSIAVQPGPTRLRLGPRGFVSK